MNKDFTRDDLINDIIKLIELRKTKELSYAAFEAIINTYSWYLTERQDDANGKSQFAKWKGCPYWTEAALELFNNNKITDFGKVFRHEHVVPKNMFKSFIENLIKDEISYTDAEDKLRDKIGSMLIGCVVTLDEDKRLNEKYRTTMPNNDISNPWERYKYCGISVRKVTWERKGNSWEKKKDEHFL